MKVDLNGLNGPALDGVSSAHRNSSDAAATSALSSESPLGEDTATLTADSARVKELTVMALDSASLRQDKIEALRQAIQNGEYKLDPRKMAEAMIEQSSGPAAR